MERPSPEQIEAAVRIPVDGPYGDVRHVEDLMTDVMAKLVDLRGVAKPPMFTGRVEDWSDFRFKMENIAALLSLDDLLQRAASGSACLEPGDEPKGKFLYNSLVQVCHGKALALVRLIPRADGASAWRSLVQEYEPDEASRHCALLVG